MPSPACHPPAHLQEAIALGLAGAELQPGGGQTGGVLQPQQKQQPDAGAEAAPVLALSRLGLARALATAAAADPQQQRAGSCEKLIVQHVEESSGVPLHLPTRLPGVEECAKGLAACAAGVPAVVAAANEQPTDDRHVEVRQAGGWDQTRAAAAAVVAAPLARSCPWRALAPPNTPCRSCWRSCGSCASGSA